MSTIPECEVCGSPVTYGCTCRNWNSDYETVGKLLERRSSFVLLNWIAAHLNAAYIETDPEHRPVINKFEERYEVQAHNMDVIRECAKNLIIESEFTL